MQHSGVEFEVAQIEPRRWVWTIYPKRQKSTRQRAVNREITAFDRTEAVAQCKLEIVRKLWRQANAQRSYRLKRVPLGRGESESPHPIATWKGRFLLR